MYSDIAVTQLQAALRQFAKDWEWEQFHTPKNLVMAIASEVGELTEIFQWLTPDMSAAIMDDPRTAQHVRDELADLLIYLLRLADILRIDLNASAFNKLKANATRYPVDRSRGSASKYTEWTE